MHRHASLNRIYRLVWSHVHQTWIVVSETARGRGKRANRKLLLAAAALASAHLAQAGPTGGQVTAGQGVVNQSGTTTTVNQSSQNLSLSWKSFDTGAAETVNFVQPSSSAIAVNRILGTDATQFFGKLNANGQVYLINPNGVLFGASAQVNVGGLVASTLDIGDDGIGGATRRFSGNGSGSIVNQGAITAAEGGYVAFIGNKVANHGTIAAPSGAVALGAGSEVTLSFAGNSLLQMRVERSTLDNLAENGGLIRADGGAVVLSAGARDAVLASVVNNTGIIEARSVRNVNGSIVLEGGQQATVANSGTLDASGRDAGASGGSVKVLGDQVALAADSRIDVGGDTGGGIALVGGNFLGAGPERNAQDTRVAAGSSIVADAVSSGNGGQVAVWSDGSTRFDGRISARGGAAGGDGGAVETSGHELRVGAGASVATLAPRGKAGDWLLDPLTLTIGNLNANDGDIAGEQITAALQSSNVTIKTGAATTCTNVACSAGLNGNDGDIILAPGALVGGNDWTSGTTLTLSAYRNIELRGTANIDAGAGTGNIVLRTDNTATGTGTVILSSDSNIFGNGTGTVDIYYNPASYASPTAFAAQSDVNGDPLIRLADPNSLRTHMLVNVAANVANKTYDRSTAATYSGLSVTGATPAGITVDFSAATAAFTNANAGANKTVVISGVTLSGVDADKYALNGLDSKTATVAKANLGLSGVTANNKTYDSTNAATISGTASVTPIAGDVVSVAGSGAGSAFATKDAGTGKSVTVAGYTLTGAAAGNYNLVLPTNLTADVAKADLGVHGVTANNKTYDSTTAATLSGTAGVTAFGGDAVSVTGTGSASFADKGAGSGKAVIVSGYTLSGIDAANYNIVQPSGLAASIDKAYISVSGVSALDKTYDGGSAAALAGSAGVTALGTDVVSVTGSGSGSFASKNAGANKTVTVTGYGLGGADAANYNLVQPTGITATIGKADLALSGIGANNKTYDGTLAATLSGTATVSALGGDVVSIGGSGTASFLTKDAANGKAVTVGGYTLAGADAGNYNLVMPANLTADIARASLAVTGVSAAGKTYDGTSAATLSGTAQVSALGADAVSVGGTGVASFADKNAGSNKPVAVSGYTLAGADAHNYDVVQPSGLSATIGKASLAVTGVSASDKVYDGTSAATLAGSAAVSALGDDDVSVTGSGSGSFASKAAGANRTVTVTGYALAGADAGNYNIVQPAGVLASIAKADILLSGLSAYDKTYDGSTQATLGGSAVVSAIGADVVGVSGSGAGSAFVTKDAGSGKAVTVRGYTLSGLDAGNYNLVMPSGLAADIGKAALAVHGVSVADKTYDAGTGATLGGSAMVAAFGSDQVSVGGAATASFASKNAGANKAVTVTGYTLAGQDAGNYDIVQPSGLSATIHKADLAVNGLHIADKTYDGSTGATLSGSAGVAALGLDAVSLQGSGSAVFADKNAGTGKAVLVSGYTLGGLDAANYNLVQPAGLSATIERAPLALSGLSVLDKTYDATTAATLSGSATVSPIGGDVVSVTGSASASFLDKTAGSAKAVIVSGYGLGGADAANYLLVAPANLTATIGKASLAVGGINALDKTYDGGTAATLAGTATVAALGSDEVRVAGSAGASFADKAAGSGKAVTVNGFTLAGLDAANYEIVQPAGLTANIGKASLAIQGLSGVDKVYDGSTAATLSGSAAVSAFGGDAVSVTGTGSAVFADKSAGTGKALIVTGYSLGGADAANYTLAQPDGLSANIARADLALTGLSAGGKVYDGGTAATLVGSASVSPIGADVVAVAGSGSASFLDKNAGSGKAVSVSGYALAGLDAGNYNLVMPAGLSADIAKASLAVTGVSAIGKTYDGGSAATLAGSASVAAFGSDDVRVAGGGSASFADKNAGAGKAVTVSGFALTGLDAANYEIVQPAGLSADIGKALLAVTGLSALDKVYDGGTAATLTGTARVSAIGNDAVAVAGSASAAFADKNAGAGKAVSVTGYGLTGQDAANYTLAQPAGLSATIHKADLVLGGLSAKDKTYDGNTAAILSGTAGVIAIGGDVVSVAGSGSASFADKNAGSGKAVSVSGYVLAGLDAGNYELVMPAGLSADIARASVTVTGVAANGKTYDGGTAATLSGTALVNAIAGDQLSVSGSPSASFADKNAGAGKAVTVTGYSLGGQDAANYSLVQPAGLSADIGRASLAVSGLAAADKVYDGGTGATLSGNATVAAIAGDDVGVAGTGLATFADKNAGTNKAVTVGGYSLRGQDAGNYTLAQPAGLSATIRKADLSLGGLRANGKTYDGTTVATLSGSALVSAIGNDAVSVTGKGSASFADKNAGSGKAVTVSGYGLAGADASNYTLLMPAGLSADIVKASLAVTGVSARGKTYDGSTVATLSGNAAVAAIAGDQVSVTGTGSARFADKNAGAAKAVSVSGYQLAGLDAANYAIVQPAGLVADIAKASLAVSGLAAANKVYDGSTAATLSGNATVAAIAGDQVSVTGSGVASFADKNAGSGKAVSVRGYALAGADAGNYALVQPSGLSASITPARLVAGGVTVADKRYDGTTGATVSTQDATLAGLIAGDKVTLASSGSFADAGVGSGKTVSLRGTLAGPDAGNYTLVDQASTLASITGMLPSTEAQVRDSVAQVQSSILPPQASAQPQALSLSSTIEVVGADKPEEGKPHRDTGGGTINTRVGSGAAAPQLQIQNGGVHLPPLAINTAE